MKVLTNEAHWICNLAPNGDYEQYLGQTETCLHMVRDCHEAAKVWTNFLLQVYLVSSSPSHCVNSWSGICLGRR